MVFIKPVEMFQKLSCLPYVFGSVLACVQSIQMFQKLSCLLYVFGSVLACAKSIQMFQKLSCLLYVFGSVLACAKSAHMFQKLSYSLCGLCLSLSSLITIDSKAFLRFIAFSGSPTAVHRAFLFFDAKAWPQSQTDLFTCTIQYYTVGIPFSDA